MKKNAIDVAKELVNKAIAKEHGIEIFSSSSNTLRIRDLAAHFNHFIEKKGIDAAKELVNNAIPKELDMEIFSSSSSTFRICLGLLNWT